LLSLCRRRPGAGRIRKRHTAVSMAPGVADMLRPAMLEACSQVPRRHRRRHGYVGGGPYVATPERGAPFAGQPRFRVT